MHDAVKNLLKITENVKAKLSTDNSDNKLPTIIAVSKTFKMDQIMPLIDYGHVDYGENKVQEAQEKWSQIKENNKNIKLHLIGRLQSNKVKIAIKLFDYIHSLDSKKVADKISFQQKTLNLRPKLFIQVNIGNEDQKNGISPNKLKSFYKYCLDKDLDVIGTMCLPPISEDPEKYFMRMNYLNKDLGLNELSMGMSADYISAIDNNATFIRVGSKIFGERKKKF